MKGYLVLLFLFLKIYAVPVSQYHEIYQIVENKNKEIRLAIRAFIIDEEAYYLLINPENLQSEISLQSQVQKTEKEISDNPYLRALNHYALPPFSLHRYGIQRTNYPTSAFFLSIDLCPSSKSGFESVFFQSLKDKKIPIAISLSALWAMKHPLEFEWLKKYQDDLNITWVNHTYTHPYIHTMQISDEHNFLL